MELHNPASRLYSILSELKHHQNSNRSTQDVLAEVIGVEKSPVAVMHAVIGLHRLLDEVARSAGVNGSVPSASLSKYLPQIEQALALTNLDAGWTNYRDRITPESLVILDVVANYERGAQDRRPLDQEIEELRNSLDDLFDFVEKTNIDPEFRRFILEQVESIRRCLAEYRIAGPQGFARYFETFIGQVVRNSPVLQREAQANPQVMSKFKSVLVSVKKFVEHSDDGIKFVGRVRETFSNGMTLLNDLTGSGNSAVPEVGGPTDSI